MEQLSFDLPASDLVRTKVCTQCGVRKPVSEFYVLKVGHSGRVNPGRFPECKACGIKRAREQNLRALAENPEKVKADRARWSRNARLRRYGLTPERYDEILAEQGGVCAICGRADSGTPGTQFPVDHDHSCCAGEGSCGECVRGLLCHGCNGGLGNFGDDPDRLLAAAAYLLARQNVLGEVAV